jgi:hypothetical protein
MKKATLPFIILIPLLFAGILSRGQAYYRVAGVDRNYFVAASYGLGTGDWVSHFQNTFLYNTDGSILESGDLKMKANNPCYNYNFSVCFPVGDNGTRLGGGICFEHFSMDKISITSLQDSSKNSSVSIPDTYVYFRESFWFNKIYGMVQLPFHFCEGKPYSLDFVVCGGFYGYNGLHHINFFGQDQISRTFFANTSFIADYDIGIKHIRIFVQPMAEYKYFHNNSNEYPSVIVHNIYCFTINFGIRVDMSKI